MDMTPQAWPDWYDGRHMYCNHSPSKEYKKSDGTSVYVCEDCSSECMICGREKATKHYESLLGIVFVCDDCYKTATGK